MPETRTNGLLVVCMIIIGCLIFGGLVTALAGDGPLATAKGGCWINFGEGCNTVITQTINPMPDLLSTPGFLLALGLIVVLGLGFLFMSRGK